MSKRTSFGHISFIFSLKIRDMRQKRHPFRHISFSTYIPRDIHPFSVFGSGAGDAISDCFVNNMEVLLSALLGNYDSLTNPNRRTGCFFSHHHMVSNGQKEEEVLININKYTKFIYLLVIN